MTPSCEASEPGVSFSRVLLDGYVRVSQVGGRGGDSFISPSVQREQIEAWTRLNGAVLGEVYEELDQSGARADRPMLLAALERVENGESQGIVVAKLDRFGRSLVDGLANIDRIDAAGGTFVSVQDGLDLNTPTGKLVLRIMFSMAEWELDRVRASWDTAKARAVARGVHISGFVPLGYDRGRGGRLKINPKAGPVVSEIFRRRGNGVSVRDLTRYLNESGLKTTRGASQFVDSSISGLIGNRVYLGEARSGRHVNSAAHPAIVDEAEWHQAQRPRKGRSKPRRSLLGAVLRCGGCRLAMFTEAPVTSGAPRASYRCPGHTSAGRCPAPAMVRADDIEGLVEEFVLRLAGARKLDPQSSERVRKLEEILERAQADLVRYRDNLRLLATLGAESFEAGLAKRQQALEHASLELAGARRATEAPNVPSVRQLEDSWPTLSLDERRDFIEELIDCIFIVPGVEPVFRRAHVCRRGSAPVDLPRRGQPIGEIRPFRSGSKTRSVPLPPMKPWGQRRIERELVTFLGDGKKWPAYPAFSVAGYSRLHQQVLDWGGPYFWANRLGIEIAPRSVKWNRQRIRGALKAFLRRRDEWPSAAEFESAGLRSLLRAVERHGGAPFWADEFGLTLRTRTPRYWTHERIQSDLARFLQDRTTYPITSEFIAAGLEPLRTAINRNGGHRLWASKMEISPTKRSRSFN